MDQTKRPREIGGWKEIKTLGTGGFGTVMLWTKEETHQSTSIALKKCRLVHEMKKKHKERWSMEIEIMLRLQHENVIQALHVPEPLLELQESHDLPMLAMEYCSEGDLRSVLNKPENSCGLKEQHVRDITRDVSAGIEYLHSNRIIHRDLKPENIVLQRQEDGRIVYKLIDLGYAKDMDQGSVCHSFVGTLQYLAPELFKAQTYSATVDFWSFGNLVFECIAGFRPFLHGFPPMQWQNEVEKKDPREIHAFLDETGRISFAKNLPKPNHLCEPSQQFFEEWLRMMLRWSPMERGGGLTHDKRHRCFDLLDRIIQTKILYIKCAATQQLFSIPVEDEQRPLSEYQPRILELTRIPVRDQELLFPTGTTADPKKPIELCFTDPIPGDKDSVRCHLFLFSRGPSPAATAAGPGAETAEWRAHQQQLPPLVKEMIGEPAILTVYPETKKVWSHSLWFVRQVCRNNEHLLDAEMAAMMCLIRHNTVFTKMKDQMKTEMATLNTKMESFLESQEFDVKKYEEQAKTGITSRKMLTRWEAMKVEVSDFRRLKQQADGLEQQCSAINNRVLELNRSPYARKKLHGGAQPDPELQAM